MAGWEREAGSPLGEICPLGGPPFLIPELGAFVLSREAPFPVPDLGIVVLGSGIRKGGSPRGQISPFGGPALEEGGTGVELNACRQFVESVCRGACIGLKRVSDVLLLFLKSDF